MSTTTADPTAIEQALDRGRRSAPRELAAFRALWREWTDIVALFAHRARARRRVDERDYADLHGHLTAACRSLGRAADPELARYFRGLEEMSQPWPALHFLARSHRLSLDLLLVRCREVDRELAGPPPAGRKLAVALASAAALAGIALAARAAASVLLPALQAADRWARGVAFALNHLTQLQSLYLFVIVSTLVGLILIRRTRA